MPKKKPEIDWLAVEAAMLRSFQGRALQEDPDLRQQAADADYEGYSVRYRRVGSAERDRIQKLNNTLAHPYGYYVGDNVHVLSRGRSAWRIESVEAGAEEPLANLVSPFDQTYPTVKKGDRCQVPYSDLEPCSH